MSNAMPKSQYSSEQNKISNPADARNSIRLAITKQAQAKEITHLTSFGFCTNTC